MQHFHTLNDNADVCGWLRQSFSLLPDHKDCHGELLQVPLRVTCFRVLQRGTGHKHKSSLASLLTVMKCLGDVPICVMYVLAGCHLGQGRAGGGGQAGVSDHCGNNESSGKQILHISKIRQVSRMPSSLLILM